MSNLLQRTESISNISIENFKAFGKRVDVPIRPITLIFGENSSGKSSILHSLLFLNQMQHQPQDKLADITYTKAGGNSVDLGGLLQLKYGHNEQNTLFFSIEKNLVIKDSKYTVETPGQSRDNAPRSTIVASFQYVFNANNNLDRIDYFIGHHCLCALLIPSNSGDLNEINSSIVHVYVDHFIDLMYDADFRKEIIYNLKYEIGQPISQSRFFDYDAFIDLIVEALLPFKDKQLIIEFVNPLEKHGFINAIQYILTSSVTGRYFIGRQTRNIMGEGIEYRILSKEHSNSSDMTQLLLDLGGKFDDMLIAICTSLQKNFRRTIDDLHNISYIGPIRTIPTRNFDTLNSTTRDPSIGSTAWEKLISDTDTRADVNVWLSKFGTNKEITTEQIVDMAQIRKILATQITKEQLLKAIDALPNHHMLRFYDPKNDIYVSHRDIGVGISQVLPVIVESVANNNTTVLVEQPELHLHPRLQGDLADLFIETAIKGEQHNTYLIETHSEHIIRRIMRRIREDQHKPADDKRITKDDVAILYVANGPHGSTVSELRLDDEGDLIDEWPNGFFEEGFRDDMAGR